jgi:dCMP deaminase
MIVRPNWDEYFLLLAKLAATRSTCLSRPVGVVIVLDKQILVTGYNGAIPGAPHCTDDGICYRRSLEFANDANKQNYCRSSHAESNALAQAARRGIAVQGATVYQTLAPCYTCTKLMAIAGIRRIVFEHEYMSPDQNRDRMWRQAIEDSGIEVVQLKLGEDALRQAIVSLGKQTSERKLD